MAQRIVHEKVCDWHAQLDVPVQLPALHVRINPQGKENDLCESCCMMFDWGMPRVEMLLAFFNREVIERLFRVGREPAEAKTERRQPAQLPLPGSQPAPKRLTAKEKAAAKETATAQPTSAEPSDPTLDVRKKAMANRGLWKDGLDQVLCPEAHGVNSPKEYWVEVRNRGSHAKSSHKKLGPQVAYELPPDGSLKLEVKCFEHKVCAAAGGYGFKNASGLAMHRTKADSEGWERVPDEDTTATGSAAPEAA